MSLFLFVLCGLTAVYLFNHRHTVIKKTKKMKTLFNLVRTQHRNIIRILWVMSILLAKTFYVWLCQSLNATFRQIDKNTFEVTYVVGGVMYKMLVKPKRGPRKIVCCVDEQLKDWTDTLNAYFGPSEDFHGKVFTPRFFNSDSLTFSLSNGDEKTFAKDEPILL